MKAFSERNPITVAIVGLVVLAGIGTATYYADDLPIIGGGIDYSANFGDAAGLTSGDDVRVAGVKVGSVDSISLSGSQVHVTFRVKDTWVGDQSTVAIKIKTLLGQEYLDINVQGTNPQPSGQTIPIGRTTTPLDVAAALSQLSTTVGSINTNQLADSFNALSAAFANTPASIKSALTGLTRLSQTIASRDTALQQLFGRTQQVTQTLAQNTGKLSSLIQDGSQLVAELESRSAAITELLQGTENFAKQIAGLVQDNQASLGPALASLGKVTDILVSNRGNLDKALQLIGPYYTMLNDAAGNGPWVDIYICGLFDSTNTPIVDKTALRNCQPKAGT
ncbi:MAG: MCE family protein [Actinobacteria bacterium]|nr:MCE family protein [Actinomycetota bacterium]